MEQHPPPSNSTTIGLHMQKNGKRLGVGLMCRTLIGYGDEWQGEELTKSTRMRKLTWHKAWILEYK